MRPLPITIIVILLGILVSFQIFGSAMVVAIALGFADNPMESSLVDEPSTNQEVMAKSVGGLTLGAAIYGFLSNVLNLIVLFGLWKMRKWAVYLFSATLAFNLILIYIVQPSWVPDPSIKPWWFPLAMPAIIFACVLPYWRRMSPNK